MILTSRDKLSGFETRLGPVDSLVTVGGYTEKTLFRPDVHTLAHGGEVFINARYPVSNAVDNPIPVNGRVEAICDGKRFGFHAIDGNELESDILFASQPSSPEIRIDITDSGNVNYGKQILTPFEIEAGAKYGRPENEGCIVGYINGKRDNQYQTGKVWQITRPQLFDKNGNPAWCEINIYPDGRGRQILIITMPWEWLKRAIYPVLLDPIIGYSSMGALEYFSLHSATANTARRYGRIVQASASGAITALKGYVRCTGDIGLAVYKADGSNGSTKLQNLHASGQATNLADSTVITTLGTFVAVRDLVANDYYGFIFHGDGSSWWRYDNSVNPTHSQEDIAGYGAFAANFPRDPNATAGASYSNPWEFSQWAEHGAVSAAKTPPHIFEEVI